MPFQFTGFTDEAEKTLEEQISTLEEVGWSAIELRLLDGKNVCDLNDDEWSQTWERLQAANVEVVGFGGQIGNWARPINSDFQVDLDELRRVAPRMRQAGTKFLRIMSYPNSEDSERGGKARDVGRRDALVDPAPSRYCACCSETLRPGEPTTSMSGSWRGGRALVTCRSTMQYTPTYKEQNCFQIPMGIEKTCSL